MRSLAIEQQLTIFGGPYDEIEHCLALRTEQRGIGGEGADHIIGDEALQEGCNIFPRLCWREPDNGAIGKAGLGHASKGGSCRGRIKPCPTAAACAMGRA